MAPQSNSSQQSMIKEVLESSLNSLSYMQLFSPFMAYFLVCAIFANKGRQCYLYWIENLGDVVIVGNPDCCTVAFVSLLKYMKTTCRFNKQNFPILNLEGFWKVLQVDYTYMFCFVLMVFFSLVNFYFPLFLLSLQHWFLEHFPKIASSTKGAN